jgi:hypothetical protein
MNDMFICQISGKLSEPGEKVHKIVIKTRDRVYSARVFNEEIGQVEDVQVGHGWEIVKEVNATAQGLKEWNEMTETQRAEHLRHM